MKKKWLLTAVLAGVLALTAGCGKEQETDAAVVTEGLVKLGNYKNVEIEAADLDSQLEDLILELRLTYTNDVEVEDVQEGDVVTIDYVGKRDGVAFEGGTDEGYELTIGSGTFIDGFEDGLIGKKVGETCELNLTFPESYHNADLAGVEVVFEVTIHKSVRAQVEEWTDAFVAEHTEYETIDTFTEGTKAELHTSWRMQNALQAVMDGSEFDCEDIIAAEEEAMRAQYESYATANNLDLETFLYYLYGITLEQFEEQIRSICEYQVQSELVMSEIIARENISLDENDYTEGLAKLAADNGAQSPEAFEEQYGKDVVEESVLYEKALSWLAEQAVEK